MSATNGREEEAKNDKKNKERRKAKRDDKLGKSLKSIGGIAGKRMSHNQNCDASLTAIT